MRKPRALGVRFDASAQAQASIPGERPKAEQNARISEQRELAESPRQAVLPLFTRGLVGWRCAPDGRRDPHAAQPEPIVSARRSGHVREMGPPQRRVKKVPRSVASEHAPRAIGAMRRRCEPKHDERGGGVPKPRNRPAPVALIPKRRLALSGNLLAPAHETRASPAACDLGLELMKRAHHSLNLPEVKDRATAAATPREGAAVDRWPAMCDIAAVQREPRDEPMSREQIRTLFGENLRRLRAREGISQESLARTCDLHRTELSLLERCMRSPRLDTMLVLAAGLGLSSVAELVEGIR